MDAALAGCHAGRNTAGDTVVNIVRSIRAYTGQPEAVFCPWRRQLCISAWPRLQRLGVPRHCLARLPTAPITLHPPVLRSQRVMRHRRLAAARKGAGEVTGWEVSGKL